MIAYGKQFIDQDDIDAVVATLKSDYLTTGPKVKEFEDQITHYTGAKYAVAVGNGTHALHMAYMFLGIQPGDEIITTPNTFVATSNAALMCGAKIVFCDIDPNTYNIDENKIEALITDRTKAIVPVHFGGLPCNMHKIHEISNKYKIPVIEDAAHALGSSYQGNMVGNLGSVMTTFSFHPVKPITTGEGGAITTNDKEVYDKLLLLRTHGIRRDENGFNDMIYLANNYRLTDIQCALGVSQMKKIENFIQRRKEIAHLYDKELSGIKNLQVPVRNTDSQSGRHLYVVRFQNKETRDIMLQTLRTAGYGVTLHYPPVYTNTYYRQHGYKDVRCPIVESYFETCLSLPIFYTLEDKDILDVCSIIKSFI